MKRRDVVLSVLLGLLLWLLSWPYQLDYTEWIDSTTAWAVSAALGLGAVIIALMLYFRSQRAVTRQRAAGDEPPGSDQPR